jgi:Ni/Co efflux regulator RcnB
MNKILIAALMAATIIPASGAHAQTRELRGDRQDVREEQRELNRERRQLGRAYAYGDRDDIQRERRDVRDERGDVREARQEYREDWRDYRHRNHGLYRAARFDAPFRYRPFNVGVTISPAYWGPRYHVHHVHRWHLPPAGPRQVYVRHYNDLLLINTRSGHVVRVYRGFFW